MKIKNPSAVLGVTVLCLTMLTLAGCPASNNRVPTQAAVKQADQKRQSYVDSLKLPDSVKAQMKSHMGGPPVPNQAQNAANSKEQGRR